jgi:hypothetical protein
MISIPGQGSTLVEVDIYRDGEDGQEIVAVGRASHVRQTPHGFMSVEGDVVVRFETIGAYEWARARAFERDPLKYVRMIGVLGIDDDARNAPMLPAGTLPTYRDDGGGGEARGRRFAERVESAPADDGRVLLLLPEGA